MACYLHMQCYEEGMFCVKHFSNICVYVVNLPIFVKIYVMVQQSMFTTTFSGNISP